MDKYLENIIGSDEVGVGDYFGPLVVCAVKIPKENLKHIQALNIKDSKLLSNNQIKFLSFKLSKLVEYKLNWFIPYTYNKQYEKYGNSHILKTILHNQVHSALAFEKCIHVVDAFASKENYIKYLDKTLEPNKIKDVVLVQKAESKYLQVAIAAIIARSWFLKWFDDYEKENGSALPLGASNDVKEIVKNIDKKKLYVIGKMHFKV